MLTFGKAHAQELQQIRAEYERKLGEARALCGASAAAAVESSETTLEQQLKHALCQIRDLSKETSALSSTAAAQLAELQQVRTEQDSLRQRLLNLEDARDVVGTYLRTEGQVPASALQVLRYRPQSAARQKCVRPCSKGQYILSLSGWGRGGAFGRMLGLPGVLQEAVKQCVCVCALCACACLHCGSLAMAPVLST